MKNKGFIALVFVFALFVGGVISVGSASTAQAYDDYYDSGYGYDDYGGYNDYGYDDYGYNDYGYDDYGYNDYGYDDYGYNDYGYDDCGYDCYDDYGYNDSGYDDYGYDDCGYDCYGDYSYDDCYDCYGDYGYSDYGYDDCYFDCGGGYTGCSYDCYDEPHYYDPCAYGCNYPQPQPQQPRPQPIDIENTNTNVSNNNNNNANVNNITVRNFVGGDSEPVRERQVAVVRQDEPLVCRPASQTASVNQLVSLTVSGGNGTYAWNAAGSQGIDGRGTSVALRYPTSGLKTVTVTSGSQTATCFVQVTGGQVLAEFIELPNTGAGGINAVLPNMLALGGAALAFILGLAFFVRRAIIA